MSKQVQNILSNIPAVDLILNHKEIKELSDRFGIFLTKQLLGEALSKIRLEVKNGKINQLDELAVINFVSEYINDYFLDSLRPVINATGVILHTNLGRAPLKDYAIESIKNNSNYSNLEFDLRNAKRRKRGAFLESMICRISGAESALVVNNCAAAVFLSLAILPKNSEVVIPRGELVEIGGGFRMPEVMERSEIRLREIGTTNSTRLSDYENAIASNTSAILSVVPSNFEIVGYKKSCDFKEVADLSKKHKIPFMIDLGSSFLSVNRENTELDLALKAGADLVCFSGDKKLSGPQSGIVVGKTELIEKMRKHPLYRAFRPDKLILSVLESVLIDISKGREGDPFLKNELTIKNRAQSFIEALPFKERVSLIKTQASIGGGSGSENKYNSYAILLKTKNSEKLNKHLRINSPHIITGIREDSLIIDFYTLSESDDPVLLKSLEKIFNSNLL